MRIIHESVATQTVVGRKKKEEKLLSFESSEVEERVNTEID